MTRFRDDGDWDYGRWSLWEQAVTNALSGKRGQAVLADLEAALLALPEARLIESYLAKDGEVCAVGALVLAKRCQAGEDRDAVLAEMSAACADEYDDTALITAEYGQKYGRMALAMAWRIAELNDEDLQGRSPEERYQQVLAWVRKAQGKELVTA